MHCHLPDSRSSVALCCIILSMHLSCSRLIIQCSGSEVTWETEEQRHKQSNIFFFLAIVSIYRIGRMIIIIVKLWKRVDRREFFSISVFEGIIRTLQLSLHGLSRVSFLIQSVFFSVITFTEQLLQECRFQALLLHPEHLLSQSGWADNLKSPCCNVDCFIRTGQHIPITKKRKNSSKSSFFLSLTGCGNHSLKFHIVPQLGKFASNLMLLPVQWAKTNLLTFNVIEIIIICHYFSKIIFLNICYGLFPRWISSLTTVDVTHQSPLFWTSPFRVIC